MDLTPIDNSVSVISWMVNQPKPTQRIKKRGRPRKYQASSESSTIHKLDDNTTFMNLTSQECCKIELEFKGQLSDTTSSSELIEQLATNHKMSYRQVYEIVKKFM